MRARAASISAACRRRSSAPASTPGAPPAGRPSAMDAGLPGIGAEDQGDRPLVLQADQHTGAEAAGLRGNSSRRQAAGEALAELLRPGRSSRPCEARATTPANIGVEGELGDDQRLAAHLL